MGLVLSLPSSEVIAVTTLAALSLLGIKLWQQHNYEKLLPPGPKKIPIFGNLFQVSALRPYPQVSVHHCHLTTFPPLEASPPAPPYLHDYLHLHSSLQMRAIAHMIALTVQKMGARVRASIPPEIRLPRYRGLEHPRSDRRALREPQQDLL